MSFVQVKTIDGKYITIHSNALPSGGQSQMSIGKPYMDSVSDERVVNNDVRHQYRVLTDNEKAAMIALKDRGLGFLELIDAAVPKGREASLAKTKIEEAVMWAIKGLTA
jgi:hypothetical protein